MKQPAPIFLIAGPGLRTNSKHNTSAENDSVFDSNIIIRKSWCEIRCTNEIDGPYLFDGYIFLDKLYHAMYDAPGQDILSSALNNLVNVSGVFCIAHLDSHQENIRIYSDSFGQYPIYYYTGSSRDEYVVSNSVYAIEEYLLHNHDIKLTRSFESALLNSAYLSTMQDISAIENINILPMRNSIRISKDRALEIVEESSLADCYFSSMSYDSLLECAAEQIKENCKYISDFCQEKGLYSIADLTGGVDTRMVLAGFYANSLQNSLRYYTVNSSSEAQTADSMISEMLCDHFGLERGYGVGNSQTDTSIVNSYETYSIGAKISYGSGAYSGLLCDAFDNWGGLRLGGFCRIGGFFTGYKGKLGPSYERLISDNADYTSYFDLFRERKTALGRNNSTFALTKNGRDWVDEYFRSYIENISHDLPCHLQNTVINVENRSRFHFGYRMALGNKVMAYFTPLLSRHILPMHSKISHAESFDGKVAFDIMKKLGGTDLVDFPFGKRAWGKTVERNAKTAKLLDEPRPHQQRTFTIRHLLQTAPRESWSALEVDRGRKFVDIFEAIGAISNDISESDDFWYYFSREKINLLATEKNVLTDVVDLNKNIFRLSSILSFYSGNSRIKQIDSEIDVGSVLRRMH